MDQPIIAIMGPTAIGKTSLSIELAHHLHGEIVTCDSVQVYQQMDIGSAKPTTEEQQGIPHHLIDMVPAGDEYNAACYERDAAAAIRKIWNNNKIPIITGGTGLYLRILLYGLVDAPAANADLRRDLETLETNETGTLRRKLEKLDPESAANIEGNNLPQLIRALEICMLTGKKASTLRKEHGFKDKRYPQIQLLVLDGDNQWLKKRIAQREQEMLTMGLLDEITSLWNQGVSKDWRVWQAVTYRQACDYLHNKITKEELIPAMVKANYAYARRQKVWFKKEQSATWIKIDTSSDTIRCIKDHITI